MINFAYVFARGGSKGLPRKNVKPLLGKPLIQYSIDTAIACSFIDKVFVSTEDNEIAAVAKSVGAEVIDRPAELASDTSPEWLSWRHAVSWTRERFGDFDHFLSLPATSPLRSEKDIEAGLRQLESTQADICIGVTPANRNPYFNMVKKEKNDQLSLLMPPQKDLSRRQEAPVVFDITTVIYVAKPSFIMKHFGLFSGKVTSIEIPKNRSVDIDDILDFKFAETILSQGY